MTYCTECGHQNDNTSNQCFNCGALLDTSETVDNPPQNEEKGHDTYVILPLSEIEAKEGTEYPLLLPNGAQINLTIPQGTKHGQTFGLADLSKNSAQSAHDGNMHFTTVIRPDKSSHVDSIPLPDTSIDTTPSSNKLPDTSTQKSTGSQANSSPLHLSTKQLIGSIALLLIVIIAGNVFLYAMIAANQKSIVALQNAATNATATIVAANAYPSFLGGKGKLALYDPLTTNSSSNWDTNSNCFFSNGSYHIFSSGEVTPCFAKNTKFTNFVFQVQVIISSNSSCGGILLHTSKDNGFFLLDICNNEYYYYHYSQNGYKGFPSRSEHSSSAIHTGPGLSNQLTVMVSGVTVTFYINQTKITSIDGSGITSGPIGLIASKYYYYSSDEYNDSQTEAVFNHVQIWTLS